MVFKDNSTVIFDVEMFSTKCCIRRNGFLQKHHGSDNACSQSGLYIAFRPLVYPNVSASASALVKNLI